MTNIIYLKRASARPASSRCLPDYEAGLSSCAPQDAAPGGSRFPRRTSSPSPQPRSLELEVHFAGTVMMMFFAGCLTVALLTLVLL